MEVAAAKDASIRKMKKNLKLLMIALIVLAIEKVCDFLLAFSMTDTWNPRLNCTCQK